MRARNPKSALRLAIVIAVPLASSFPASASERVSCSSTTPERTTCNITEPNVTRRLSPYPQITFRPGDRVTVQAGGCVQTGGHGVPGNAT
jgi:hypothetical protein